MKHVPELDGLRAFAVGAVILDHTLSGYFPGGFIGVDVFFVLSGYLITRILSEEYANSGDIKLLHFYGRRVLRLMPALWTMLAVYIMLFGFDGPNRTAVINAFFYITNIYPSPPLTHTWSLGIEEQFYFLWPLMLFALLRNNQPVWKFILATIITVVTWRIILLINFGHEFQNHIYHGFDTRSDQLMIGCLLAFMPMEILQATALRFVPIPIIILAGLLVIADYQSLWYLSFGISLTGLCAAWLIVAATAGGGSMFCRVLRWGPINYCGRISYGIYLWHYVIIAVLWTLPHMNSIRVTILTFVLTLLVASASYFMIEKPAMKLRRYLRPAGILYR